MEEILPLLKDKLNDKIQVQVDDEKLTFTITIIGEIFGKLAYPGEIQTMLIMFGDLKEEIPMKVDINESDQTIILMMENKEDYNKIKPVWQKIWNNAVTMLSEVLKGNFEVIKEIPNIDD